MPLLAPDSRFKNVGLAIQRALDEITEQFKLTELGDQILNDYRILWGEEIFARPEPGKESENLKARAARYAARAELLKGQSAKMLAPPPVSPDSNNGAASSAKRRRARAPQRSPRPT